MQRFTIGTPCHENWNAMTAQEQGRFCAVCSKCVVDLTGKSQTQIKEIYQESEGDLCGRMPASQAIPTLKERRALREEALAAFQNSMKRMRQFAAALFMAFAFLFGAKTEVKAQHIMGKIAPVTVNKDLGNVQITLEENGRSLAGEKVEILVRNAETGEHVRDTYATEGRLYLNRLEPGKYTVHAEVGDLVGTENFTVRKGGTANVKVNLHGWERMMMGDIAIDPAEYYVEPVEPIEEPTEVVIEGKDQVVENQVEAVDPVVPEKVLIEKVNDTETSGENGLEAIRLVIFPNPTDQIFQFRVDNATWNEVVLRITDMSGRVIMQAPKSLVEGKTEMDLGNLANGTYLVTVIHKSQTLTKKLIVE